ncbi:MAG: hypothetical protein ACOX0P_02285 [Candidatus Dojkabacteria bacterium]
MYKQKEKEKERNPDLFLLPSCACDTPDKGKKSRYPHMLKRSDRIISFAQIIVNPI